MRGGRIFEPAIAAAVQEEYKDWTVKKAEHYYRHPEKRIGATPDYFRVIGDGLSKRKEVIECKFVQPKIFETEWQKGPPLYYVLQCLTQIYICEADAGWIACMLDNRAKDLQMFRVERNQGAWDRICTAVDRFWEDVAKEQMPIADYAMDLSVLKDLHPPVEGEVMDFSDSNRIPEILGRREHIVEQVNLLKAEQEAIDAEIIEALGGASLGTMPGYKISYKTQKRKAYTVPESEFSVLRIMKLKGEVV
jgi:predicted phage-related endonuclease